MIYQTIRYLLLWLIWQNHNEMSRPLRYWGILRRMSWIYFECVFLNQAAYYYILFAFQSFMSDCHFLCLCIWFNNAKKLGWGLRFLLISNNLTLKIFTCQTASILFTSQKVVEIKFKWAILSYTFQKLRVWRVYQYKT